MTALWEMSKSLYSLYFFHQRWLLWVDFISLLREKYGLYIDLWHSSAHKLEWALSRSALSIQHVSLLLNDMEASSTYKIQKVLGNGQTKFKWITCVIQIQNNGKILLIICYHLLSTLYARACAKYFLSILSRFIPRTNLGGKFYFSLFKDKNVR